MSENATELGALGVALALLTLRSLQLPTGPQSSLPGPVPAGDENVELATSGRTRYRLARGKGRLVVLVHGISYPMEVYGSLYDALRKAGRSVLMYDITGRGFSASSGAPMSISHCVVQLRELLAALALDAAALDLVGWSLGSVIVTRFADESPTSVGKLVLLAPVGALPPKKPLAAHLLRLPLGVGAAIARLAVPSALRKLYTEELSGLDDGGVMLGFLCDHAQRNPGLPRALRSTLMHCPELDDNRATLARVGSHDRPVLVMWGELDGTTSRANVDGIMALLPRARLAVLRGERHAVMLTAARELDQQINEFLR